MLAVLVNCIAIIIGSLIGVVFSKKISDNLSKVVQTGAGVVTVVIGMEMALAYDNIIFLAMAIITGGIIGSWMDIDGRILMVGDALGRLVLRKSATSKTAATEGDGDETGASNFAYGFLNSSVLFCVGAMAILGSLKAGIDGDYTIIFTKSVLDGFMAIVFAAALGIGSAFSALSVLVYQGGLTLLAALVAPYVNDILLAELGAAGGVLIIMIGLNLIGIARIKTADYLPALVLSGIFVVAKDLLVG
ncbi:MAG: DUF554 domain-containing protein [Spirochaetaceae bacterium]|nr:DUF554 domain-containing protein [Spirochaetaceae bacterium]